MTCAESRTMMFMRDDEVTKKQKEALRRHVKTCIDCAAYMQEVKNMTMMIGKVRLFQPILSDPETLTSGILNEVDKARRIGTAASSGFPDRLLGFLLRPSVRIAYGMFVLTSIAVFLIQQLSVAADVQMLETRMVQRGDENAAVQVVYAVPSNIVERLPQTQQVRSYFEGARTERQDGLLVISERSLSKAVGHLLGGVIFRSNNAYSDDASRRSLETFAETLERSASSRVIIRQ